ncbi:MAG: hypothetical protein GF317_12980 [Candidatus Lokiarchaeota archaeon]|nr:hypothetical protein [Candidatus Lokiarchaeota archaeon]MBD3200555.1 hypothetical protein [Candidatus Lokiarchaeota archaeon]
MTLDINTTLLLVLFFFIYGIFLFFDVFQRNEKYRYLAYLVALLPTNYMWGIGFDVILVYAILFGLWIICILRDIIFVYRKTKEYNDIFLFLILGVLIQIIIAAVLPGIITDLTNPSLNPIAMFWYFYLPDIYSPIADPTYVLVYRILLTFLIILITGPLLLDIKGEEIIFPVLLVIVAIFILPFILLSYIWLPNAIFVLTLLFCVVLFVILLIITRSGKELRK